MAKLNTDRAGRTSLAYLVIVEVNESAIERPQGFPLIESVKDSLSERKRTASSVQRENHKATCMLYVLGIMTRSYFQYTLR